MINPRRVMLHQMWPALTAFLVSAIPQAWYFIMLARYPWVVAILLYVHDYFYACYVVCLWVLLNKILFLTNMIHWSLHSFMLSTIANYLSLISETHFQCRCFFKQDITTNLKIICNESGLNYAHWNYAMI